MRSLPLVLGPLDYEGTVYRSGLHWLYESGHVCRPNEVVAYCNIRLEGAGVLTLGRQPFEDERTLQIAFAPRQAGILRIAPNTALGGYLNHLGAHHWDPSAVVATLDTEKQGTEPLDAKAGTLRLMMLAGRRMSELADVHGGLLPGWHSRSRAWWCEKAGAVTTLLSLGICDVTGPIRGDRFSFLEMFEAGSDSTQVVSIPDHPIAPCAPVLLEQLTRSASEYKTIAADVMRGLRESSVPPNGQDLLFAGTMLDALDQSPMRDTYELLTPTGLRKTGPADAILLSLTAETPIILRHKTLGYRLHMLRHHKRAAGPAMRAWLAAAFEPVKRRVEDIRHDYSRLFDAVGDATRAHVLVLNRMSTSGHEDISSYAPFDAPMGDMLANIASKELNLMLHELTAEHDISIIDIDAIAADIGGSDHLPDGIHQSGTMQSLVRDEILHVLASRSLG